MKNLSILKIHMIILIITAQANIITASAINHTPKTTKEAFDLLEKHITNIQNQDKGINEDIEEIDSPAIKAEKNRSLIAIDTYSRQLDSLIRALPKNEQQVWQNKQTTLLTSAKPSLKSKLQDAIKNAWSDYKTELLGIASSLAMSGIQAAAINFTIQATQMGTGNLLALNNQLLLERGLASVSLTAINTLAQKTSFLSITKTAGTAIASTITNQTLVSSLLNPMNRALRLPTFTGAIQQWLTLEAIAIVNETIENNRQDIKSFMQKINTKEILLGKNVVARNSFVEAAFPEINKVIQNEKITSTLLQIGWIGFESALVGGLLYAAGFGYAGTSAIESLGYAALTGLAQGSLAAMMSRQAEPGALVNIATAPIAQQLFNIAGATPQAAATGLIQVTTQEAVNVMLDQSQKAGGLWNILEKSGNAVKNTIQSRWSNSWATVSEGWNSFMDSLPSMK
jgi:hypothetical protein